MNIEEIKIRPEGFSNTIVFENGSCSHCGQEDMGMTLYLENNNPTKNGGVLKRSDMKLLVAIFQNHLQKFPIME